MTGTMSVSRSEMEDFIRANGGEVVKSVTNKCTHLMSAESGTMNCADAEKIGVIIVDEAWVRAQCQGGESDDEMEIEEKEETIGADSQAVLNEKPFPEIEEFFRTSPLKRYLESPYDSNCLFWNDNGTWKFWKADMSSADGKFFLTILSGDVGSDGTSERVEFEKQIDAIRARSRLVTSDAIMEYSSFDFHYKCLKEEDAERRKKAAFAACPPPTITAFHQTKDAVCVPILQKFLATYDYLGDRYFLDYTSKDKSNWQWYEAIDEDELEDYDVKEMKKAHKALVKSVSFLKKASKENPYKTFQEPQGGIYHMDSVFELSIDKVKYYLLTFSMCVNDPMGQYNVLLDGKKNEIFRIEVYDTIDPSIEEDGVWKTPSMQSKYYSFVKRIEYFILYRHFLGFEQDFTFDWEENRLIAK
jgi:hypothetical protein